MLGRQIQSVQLEPDPLGGSFAGSAVLHIAIVGAIILYTLVLHHFHGSEWGNNQAPGAIQATLVSSAPTIPLPTEVPPTPNVLATDTPSPAPTPPQPMAKPVEPPPDAVPIPLKQTPPKQEKKPPVKEQPKPQPKARPQPTPQTASKFAQPVPNQRNRANYGEAAATQIPHSLSQNNGQESNVNTPGGDFGSRFPWYVAVINRNVKQNWYTQEATGTPPGRIAKVIFIISRDGHPSSARISQSSGSATLDSSALRAVQRVDTFGPLPPGYTGSNLSVEYTFTYSGANQ